MIKVTEQDVTTHVNEWLIDLVPSNVDEGISAVRKEINDFLSKKSTELVSVIVKVWIDHDDGQVVLFTYIACSFFECCKGNYRLDTRFWQPYSKME